MDWNDLKYCAHVAREGSTLAAARVLNTSQTTVMRRIAALEEDLGYELFEKRRAGYLPSEALKALLPKLEAIEAAHAAFEHEAAQTGRSLKGKVRFTASELLISHLVGGALMAFARDYPDIDVELYTSDQFLDLTRGEADIALRAGDPPTEPSLFGRRIVGDTWHLCCGRAYAEKHGIPQTIEELQQHTVITVIEGLFKSPVTDWLKANVPKERIAFRHNSLTTIYMSMKAGMGISPCPDVLSAVDPDLVRCMPLPVDVGKELWLLAPERLKKAPHVRVLLDFLATRLSDEIRQAESRLAAVR
jgi:DNA-binding transcriptional LysR family regulator